MRRLFLAVFAVLLFATACGDDSSTTDPPETTAPTTAPTTEAPTTTEPPPTTTEAPDESTTTEAPPEAATVAVTLEEFTVTTDAEFNAGVVTFSATNMGSFPHEFGIAVGASYDDLPKLANGAIDEEALGADFLGKTDAVPAGETASIDFDLAADDYVLFCNIQVGPNSHAAAGQTLSVSVA